MKPISIVKSSKLFKLFLKWCHVGRPYASSIVKLSNYVLYKTAIESQDSRLELVRLMISGIFKNSFDDGYDDEDVDHKDGVSADYNDDDNDDVGDGRV